MPKEKIRIKSAGEKNLFRKKAESVNKALRTQLSFHVNQTGLRVLGCGAGVGQHLKVFDRITDMKNAYIIWECNKVTKSYYVNSIYIDSIVPAQ